MTREQSRRDSRALLAVPGVLLAVLVAELVVGWATHTSSDALAARLREPSDDDARIVAAFRLARRDDADALDPALLEQSYAVGSRRFRVFGAKHLESEERGITPRARRRLSDELELTEREQLLLERTLTLEELRVVLRDE